MPTSNLESAIPQGPESFMERLHVLSAETGLVGRLAGKLHEALQGVCKTEEPPERERWERLHTFTGVNDDGQMYVPKFSRMPDQERRGWMDRDTM